MYVWTTFNLFIHLLMDTWAFFTFWLWCVVGWVYKDLFDHKQDIFKSDAVNPLSGAGLTLPVFLAWVPVVSLTLCLFPTSPPCPPPSSLMC